MYTPKTKTLSVAPGRMQGTSAEVWDYDGHVNNGALGNDLPMQCMTAREEEDAASPFYPHTQGTDFACYEEATDRFYCATAAPRIPLGVNSCLADFSLQQLLLHILSSNHVRVFAGSQRLVMTGEYEAHYTNMCRGFAALNGLVKNQYFLQSETEVIREIALKEEKKQQGKSNKNKNALLTAVERIVNFDTADITLIDDNIIYAVDALEAKYSFVHVEERNDESVQDMGKNKHMFNLLLLHASKGHLDFKGVLAALESARYVSPAVIAETQNVETAIARVKGLGDSASEEEKKAANDQLAGAQARLKAATAPAELARGEAVFNDMKKRFKAGFVSHLKYLATDRTEVIKGQLDEVEKKMAVLHKLLQDPGLTPMGKKDSDSRLLGLQAKKQILIVELDGMKAEQKLAQQGLAVMNPSRTEKLKSRMGYFFRRRRTTASDPPPASVVLIDDAMNTGDLLQKEFVKVAGLIGDYRTKVKGMQGFDGAGELVTLLAGLLALPEAEGEKELKECTACIKAHMAKVTGDDDVSQQAQVVIASVQAVVNQAVQVKEAQRQYQALGGEAYEDAREIQKARVDNCVIALRSGVDTLAEACDAFSLVAPHIEEKVSSQQSASLFGSSGVTESDGRSGRALGSDSEGDEEEDAQLNIGAPPKGGPK